MTFLIIKESLNDAGRQHKNDVEINLLVCPGRVERKSDVCFEEMLVEVVLFVPYKSLGWSFVVRDLFV